MRVSTFITYEMLINTQIKIKKAEQSRIKEVDFNDLAFGKYYSDHMLVADFKDGQWQQPELMPYGPMPLYPTISALHYGQSIFEGMKAFRAQNGDIALFRPMENWMRMCHSAERMGMPAIPESLFSEVLPRLVKLDEAWIPTNDGCSLYIRPVMFATDEKVGVHASDTYRFVVFTTPVGLYYSKPLRALAQKHYIRAAQGGIGGTKAAGNYGGAMQPSTKAKEQGYDQIIWLDAKEFKYIEEAGTMNIMVVIDGVLTTPPVGSTTLDGVTRKSLLQLARHWGLPVEERPISIGEVIDALKNNRLQEVFGVGTAATVSNIIEIGYEGVDYKLPELTSEHFSARASRYLKDLRYGRTNDEFGWMVKV